jgi:hypothetical protein
MPCAKDSAADLFLHGWSCVRERLKQAVQAAGAAIRIALTCDVGIVCAPAAFTKATSVT